MTRIAVLGPGGVGGLLAAALARADEQVVVVARGSTAARIAERGISVRSVRLGEFTAWPEATGRLVADVEALLVATKATGLADGLRRIEVVPPLVVPLLNGLDHMRLLRERFGPRVAAGTIRVESDRPGPGVIVHSSPFLRIELASDDPALTGSLEALAATLEHAGIPATIGRSEAQILWSKLVRLCALACTTSAFDASIGAIRADPEWCAALERAVAEAAAVALAEGAAIDPADTIAELEEAHPGAGSSMQRDIASGREPELDAIAGSVLRAGARHGLECPTIARLSARIAERAGIAAPAS